MLKGLKHLYSYRDLFLILVWRDLSVRYQQAVLGIAWAVIQPLSMMLLFTFIFTYIMPVKISNIPKPVFFYAGLLPWTFFLSSVNDAIPSLIVNYNLVKKIYFPKIFLPTTGLVVAKVDFLISLVLFFGLLSIFKIPLTWSILWIIPLFILLILFTLSLALILSALNVYYRDVSLASAFLLRLLFFASPILYSINDVSERLKLVLMINPMTFIIENMRRCMVEGRTTNPWQYAIMLAFSSILLIMSYQFFRRTEKKFSDVI